MEKHNKILWWLIWIIQAITSFNLFTGFAFGGSNLNFLLLITLAVNFYCLYTLKTNKEEKTTLVLVLNTIFCIYLVDSGFDPNLGTFLFYVPVLIGLYLFDSSGIKIIKPLGISASFLSILLVNLGWSPQLIFKELAQTLPPNEILAYNAVTSIVCSLAVLQIFSQQRRRALEEISVNQANIIALLENSKDAIWSVDSHLKLVSFNAVYAKMFKGFWQKPPQSGLSILFDEGRHKIYDDWNAWYRRAIKGEAFSFDIEYNFRDGHKIFEVSFTPILKGDVVHGSVIKAIDITQRKLAYIEQQLITENLELLLGSTQEILFEMDQNDKCTKVWKGLDFVLYFPETFFIGKTVEDLFDKPFGLNMGESFKLVKEDGKPRDLEYSYPVKNELRYFLAKLRKIRQSNPARVSVVVEDITDRKLTEIKIAQQSIFLNKLIAHLPIGVFVKSVSQNLTYTIWNKELENLFGLKESDVLGKTDLELFKDSGEIETYLATDEMVLKDKEPLLIQKLNIQVGNKQIVARTFKIPLLDSFGNVESIIGILENITEVVKSQLELANAEKRWNYALSGSRDAVWDVDLIKDESFFSPVLNEMLGYKSYETLEEKWEELVHPEDLPKAWNLFIDHLEGKSHYYECEYRMKRKDGTYFWVLDRGKVAETDKEGNPIRIIGTFSNIDYRKKLEHEYKLALQKAEEASNAKSLFLSTMSHEIRTPMNGVIGIIHLLLNENPKTEQLESLKSLKYSADNLLYLLNDILDFSKIDAGKMDIEHNSFDLYESIQQTVKSFLTLANNKGLELELKASNNFPKAVIGDALRLNQIFSNLLSNSIKFTEKGKVSVSAVTEQITEDSIHIRFSFKDTGIGIDPSFIPHLFEHFTQASNETTRKFGGTGLGLAICNQLVGILGGKLQVSSEKGKGTEFWFSLTFLIDKQKTTLTPENENKQTYYSGMKVLLVEDNQINVFVAKKFLASWQITVEVAGNGLEALEKVAQKSFDLILMDLQMPIMDGFESATKMRKLGINTPILALTANVNSEARILVLDSGMNDYISKPFNPEELFQKIGKYYQPKPVFTGKLF